MSDLAAARQAHSYQDRRGKRNPTRRFGKQPNMPGAALYGASGGWLVSGDCGEGTGETAQTAFVIEDGEIVEWRRVVPADEPAPGSSV